jgi:hypothetical protein
MECRLRQRSICLPLNISGDVSRVFLRSVTLASRHRLKCAFRRCPAVCGWWVEVCVIWCARLHGLLHGIVDVEDDALGAVFAVGLLVLAFDDGEGLQNVVHVVAPDAVEVEVGRVGLA